MTLSYIEIENAVESLASKASGELEVGIIAYLQAHLNELYIAIRQSATEQIDERDDLRRACVEAQDGLCAVCGHGLYGDAQVHEAIVKRNDLPGDPRIFVPINCCALHRDCHENTAEVDRACIDWLVYRYGLVPVQNWILSLELKELPGRASGVMRREK